MPTDPAVIPQRPGASPDGERAVAASPSSPTVSPVPASIPSAVEGWLPHRGGDCPVHRDDVVRFRLRDGYEDVWPAHKLNWRYGTTIWELDGIPMPKDCEIVAYKMEPQS